MDTKMFGIAKKINQMAKNHPIGNLQNIRKSVKKLQQRPSLNIFDGKTIFDRYAFHLGGRKELQFNIGFEEFNGVDELRYGIAFSLETGKSLPKIDVLVPKTKLFNEFLRQETEEFADMKMWWYIEGERCKDHYPPICIPQSIITEGTFIFIGMRQPLDKLDYETILDVFDRFLPLYEFIESGRETSQVSKKSTPKEEFRPGCNVRIPTTTFTYVQRQIDIDYRHKSIQVELAKSLIDKYGEEHVADEYPNGIGTKIDLVVHMDDKYWYY